MLLAVLKGRDTELGEEQRGRTRLGQENLGKLLCRISSERGGEAADIGVRSFELQGQVGSTA